MRLLGGEYWYAGCWPRGSGKITAGAGADGSRDKILKMEGKAKTSDCARARTRDLLCSVNVRQT